MLRSVMECRCDAQPIIVVSGMYVNLSSPDTNDRASASEANPDNLDNRNGTLLLPFVDLG